jgi:hypothetical protein
MSGSGWSNQVQFLVIVAGGGIAGVYVYDPTAGPGNLIASLTDSTVDPFGNTTEKGVTAYPVVSGDTYAVNLNKLSGAGTPGMSIQDLTNPPDQASGIFGLADGTSNAVALLYSGRIAGGDVQSEILASSQTMSGITNGEVHVLAGQTLLGITPALTANDNTGAVTATAGTAANPTLVTTDTWHDMTLLNSWTLGGGGYARYMMGNNGNVYVEGDNVIPGTTTGGTNVWTIPAAYIPGVQTQRVLMFVEVSTGAPVTDTPRFDATTGGQFQCFNVPGSTTRVGFNAQYSLT